MNSPVDYEYEAMQKREQQEAAIRAEEKKDWKRLGLRFVLHMLLCIVLTFGGFKYSRWLNYDWFTPPAEVLTESEFHELVDGYLLLAEALGGTNSSNADESLQNRFQYELDHNGDGATDAEILIWLYGGYGSTEELHYNGCRKRYGLRELLNGRAWAVKEETIYVDNHEAEIVITVHHPSKGDMQARAAVEKMLAIVRQGAAE